MSNGGWAGVGAPPPACIDDPRRSAFFLRQHDLRKGDLREVAAVAAVDHFDFVAVAHELRDLIERDVTARARVVEVAGGGLLDKVLFGGWRHLGAHFKPWVNCSPAAGFLRRRWA